MDTLVSCNLCLHGHGCVYLEFVMFPTVHAPPPFVSSLEDSATFFSYALGYSYLTPTR